MNWLPIATAPKDGTPVLLWDVSTSYGRNPKGGAWMVATYHSYSQRDVRYPGGQWDSFYGPGSASNPTHWAPLPPPPDAQPAVRTHQNGPEPQQMASGVTVGEVHNFLKKLDQIDAVLRMTPEEQDRYFADEPDL